MRMIERWAAEGCVDLSAVAPSSCVLYNKRLKRSRGPGQVRKRSRVAGQVGGVLGPAGQCALRE